MFKKTAIIFFLLSVNALAFANNSIYSVYGAEKITSKIHVISIGINKYSDSLSPLRLCVSDSEQLITKIINDNKERENPLKDSYGNPINSYNISEVSYHALNDEKATVSNIRNAFKTVINEASYNDYFVFLFSGYSMENAADETFLVPYLEDYSFNVKYDGKRFKYTDFDESKLLSLVEISKLMNQIICRDQLIISEAGYGSSFSQNLISELFESNPYIAEGTLRNRIILTTKEMGIEGGSCNGESMQTGYLMKYILDNGNLLDAFYDINTYEFWLTYSEMSCPQRPKKYIALFQESDYRNILLKNANKINSRGSRAKALNEDTTASSKEQSKAHAIIIATNQYESKQDWKDLKNPINDAKEVAVILSEKYNVNTHVLYDKTKEEILSELKQLKASFKASDKLIVFIAGHGYYSNDFSDGFIVLKDSKPLEDDFTLESYLQMATINRLLDNLTPKNIFVIFDVCFGATFDLNAKDIRPSNYSNLELDISLGDFISRKSKNISRLFIASGKQEVPDYWNNSLNHSPFANKLIKSLKNEKEFLSPGRLFSQLEGNITEPFLKRFGKHDVTGDFLLKVYN